MLPVNSVLPGSCSHPMLPQSSVTYAFSKQPPLDLSLVSKKRYPSVFFRSPPGPTLRGTTFAVPAPPRLPPNSPIHRMERIHFSAALHSSSLITLSLLNSSFFVLRSAFFSESQKRTLYHSLPFPPMSDCVSLMRACVRLALWFGMGSDSLDQSTAHFFFLHPVLYYLHITGDSVY
jgi:hypothetical protein